MLEFESFFEQKTGKIVETLLFSKKTLSKAASTSTKTARNRQKSKENREIQENLEEMCEFWKENRVRDQDLCVISNKSGENTAICVGCYLENLRKELDFPNKPEFSLEKL